MEAYQTMFFFKQKKYDDFHFRDLLRKQADDRLSSQQTG